MSEPDKQTPDPENIRVEYQVASESFIHAGGTRFTIAGFYLAATGFLAQATLDHDASPTQQALVGLFGLIVGISVWILELRTRSLCYATARRMIEIERKYWFPAPEDWYEGEMSRNHKTLPRSDHPLLDRIPVRPEPERPKIAWMKKPLPPALSWHVTHSMGFDILYPATIIFWFAVLVWSIYNRFF